MNNLGVNSVLEIGYRSAELVHEIRSYGIACEGIDCEGTMQKSYLYNVSLHEFVLFQSNKYNLVFSSGVLEHYSDAEAMNLISMMADLANDYVLNLVPNSNCMAYTNAKRNWPKALHEELGFTEISMQRLTENALPDRVEFIATGTMAADWTKRFGPEKGEPYLIYSLAKLK